MSSAPALKPLMLYMSRLPNGFKISIYLEELKLVYGGPQYDLHPIDISTNEQKKPWFISLNPNGRLPTLTDRTKNNFNIFESSAIMLYLSQHYDIVNEFCFDLKDESEDYSEMMQWIFFSHGGIGPTIAQAAHFLYHTAEKNTYVEKRYIDESKRLFGVYEIRLKDRDYLVGEGRGKYSIADIATWPLIRNHGDISKTLDEWPNLKAWVERIAVRPGVQAGINVIDENYEVREWL